MIKKTSVFKWGHNEKQSFDSIKQVIIISPALNIVNFSSHFILYTLATETSYDVVLTQIND